MDQSTLVVAIIQQPPVFLNVAASTDLAVRLVASVAKGGAKLVVFPETWLPGYPVWLDYAPGAALWGNLASASLFAHLFDNAPALDGPELAQIASAAVEHDIDVVIGLHERRGASLYNSVVLLGSDGTRGLHRKLVPTYTERLIWGQGDGSTLDSWTRPYGELGALICWEHWMPLARAAMHARHEVVHVAQWPAVGDLHRLASRHYAFEGQCHVVAVGCVLSRDDVLDGFASAGGDASARALLETIPTDTYLLKDGGSTVIAPDASDVVASAGAILEPIFAELDLTAGPRGRLYLDVDGHYARPDIFNLRIDRSVRTSVSDKEAC